MRGRPKHDGTPEAAPLHSTADPRPRRITAFTATWNRAHVLHRVYDSLREQTFQDFEWLIVDNDSQDETAELVKRWQAEAPFPIRYVRHTNRGFHVSWNRAVDLAVGEFFAEMRSADTFPPHALARLVEIWDGIDPTIRDGFVGVTGLTTDEHGTLIGGRYPLPVFDSDTLEARYRYKIRGEKWGFQRTDILRAHPLPIIDGYRGYVPEGIIWARIARRFKTRYVNEVLRVYWQDQGSTLSRPRRPEDNALGGVLLTEEFLNEDTRWFTAAPLRTLAKAVKYVWASLHAGRGLRTQVARLQNRPARLMWLAALPAGIGLWILDRVGLSGVVSSVRNLETD